MILKFRNSVGFENNWEFLDNIKRLSNRILKKKHRQDSGFEPNIYIQELNKEGRINENNQCYKYIFITKEDESILTFCSNREVYLLSDSGKTIEKLN